MRLQQQAAGHAGTGSLRRRSRQPLTHCPMGRGERGGVAPSRDGAMTTKNSEAQGRGVVAKHQNAARDRVLVCESVSRWFGGLQALKEVDLVIARGEILGLVGPNGSGKTTLVNSITGFYPPQQGRILFEGQEIHRLKPHQIRSEE